MQETPSLPDTDKIESALLANIRALIESARRTVARGVDLVQVHTNFEIGRHIVEFEQHGGQRATYGDALLTLPGARGNCPDSLWTIGIADKHRPIPALFAK